jgi:hypothetical protein
MRYFNSLRIKSNHVLRKLIAGITNTLAEFISLDRRLFETINRLGLINLFQFVLVVDHTRLESFTVSASNLIIRKF